MLEVFQIIEGVWESSSGKYFQTSAVSGSNKRVSFYDCSANFDEAFLVWPLSNSVYKHPINAGATWFPLEDNIYFSTVTHCNQQFKLPRVTVVGIDVTSGTVVSEIEDGIDNSKNLIEYHNSRNWIIAANASGSGDIVIYSNSRLTLEGVTIFVKFGYFKS